VAKNHLKIAPEETPLEAKAERTTPSLNSDGDLEITDLGGFEFIIKAYQNEPECTLAKIFKGLPLASCAGKPQKRLVSCGREARGGRIRQ
jgi:hypothetical protein